MDITELLAFSAKQNASDLHLSAGLPPMVRVDGDVGVLIYRLWNTKKSTPSFMKL